MVDTTQPARLANLSPPIFHPFLRWFLASKQGVPNKHGGPHRYRRVGDVKGWPMVFKRVEVQKIRDGSIAYSID
jgi:hypothetical protein